jgi:hypothetical protein
MRVRQADELIEILLHNEQRHRELKLIFQGLE